VTQSLGTTPSNLFGKKAREKKSRNSHTLSGGRRGHGDKSSQLFPNITPNINAQKMPLLSHLLRSAWNPLETNCCSFPCSLRRTASGVVLAPEPPCATWVGSEFPHVFLSIFHFFVRSRAFSCLLSKFSWDRTSPRPEIWDQIKTIYKVVWSEIFGWETSDLAKTGLSRVHRPSKCPKTTCPISKKSFENLSDFRKKVGKCQNWTPKRKLLQHYASGSPGTNKCDHFFFLVVILAHS